MIHLTLLLQIRVHWYRMNLTFFDLGLTYYAYFYVFILLCFICTSYIVIYINCSFYGFVLLLLSPGIRIDLLYGYVSIKLLRKIYYFEYGILK